MALACLAAAVAAPARPQDDPARLLMRDGFEEAGFSSAGGLFYKDNPEQRAGSIRFTKGHAFTGEGSITLGVVASCKAARDACSERAEVWERPEMLAGFDQSVWYGFAIDLTDPLPTDDGRYVLAQWKREIIAPADRDYSPFMALRLYGGRLGVTVETDMVVAHPIGGAERPDGCRPGEARVLSRPTAGQTRALVAIESGASQTDYPAYFDSCAPEITVTRHADLPPAQKGWIDFVMRSRPGPKGDGHVEILADGVHIATVKGAIGHDGADLGPNQYFKFGPYREPGALPWSVSYDDFRRGPRCADVMRGGQCPLE
jgi:hypothetical protein